MALIDKRARRLASRLGALSGILTAARAHEAAALVKAGQYLADPGAGSPDSVERASLEAQARAGIITRLRAGYELGEVSPSGRYAGGRFGDQEQERALGIVAQRLAKLRGGSAGLSGSLKASAPSPSVQPGAPAIPKNYDQVAVQDALESIQARAQEPPRAFKAHTIDGSALVPGTVPAEALDAKSIGREMLSFPDEDAAIELEYIRETNRDIFISNPGTGVSGPGRIWRAREVRATQRARIGVGPARYRIIKPQMVFGVMSLRFPLGADMMANVAPGFLVQYGVVVTGIPHYLGRKPSRIRGIESVGESPVPFRSTVLTGNNNSIWATGGTNRDFYWSRTQSQHLDSGSYPFGEGFGTDAAYAPSAANLRDFAGFSVQLITGSDAGAVWRQLCSRQGLGRLLRMDGHGPGVTIPEGFAIESPTMPHVVTWGNPTSYTHRQQSFNLIGSRVVSGVPFSYDDCVALAPTETHFSLVIMPIGERVVAQAPAPTYGTPEVWHQNGIRLLESPTGRLRSWAVDIIVD